MFSSSPHDLLQPSHHHHSSSRHVTYVSNPITIIPQPMRTITSSWLSPHMQHLANPLALLPNTRKILYWQPKNEGKKIPHLLIINGFIPHINITHPAHKNRKPASSCPRPPSHYLRLSQDFYQLPLKSLYIPRAFLHAATVSSMLIHVVRMVQVAGTTTKVVCNSTWPHRLHLTL